MAFRKTVRSVYEPSPYFGGFHERKFETIEDGSTAIVQELVGVPVSVLSSESLPLVDASSLLGSGKKIDGNVNFEPSFVTMQESVTSKISNLINS